MTSSLRENTIDYIEMFARQTADMKQFYRSAFEWTFEDYGPDYTSFSDGRLTGGFTTAASGPSQGVLLVLFATDLAGCMARIRSAGGAIVKDIFSFPGGRRFHFTDPAGNELAVWSDMPVE